ncbi:MAG TPA: hypothetical protein VFK35_12245 [Candidatus Limnocylindrales bacterium]|nr:hypothetical protein [Candidatus Limnocylindrales bacterium]
MTGARTVGTPGTPGTVGPAVSTGAGTGHLRTRGHDRATDAVRTMIAGRVPHAILISGPAGIGKTTLALDLAAGLLCDDPDPAARPCRGCRACRLVERGRHPDVHRLAPGGAGDQIRIGSRDRPEDGTVRRLTSDLVLRSVEGGARVAIVERADRLTEDAQAALLKTLEEPPADVTIVLCADDEDRLLPTVRSRAARLRLGPVATRDVEAILLESGSADPPLAARLARIVGGRPGAARALAAAPDAVAARDEIARTLLDLLQAPIATRLAAAHDLTTRATSLARAIDRASASATGESDAGTPRRPGRGARTRPTAATVAPSTPVEVSQPEAAADGSEADADGGPESGEGSPRSAVPAAERRRAAGLVVGLWRELARDLLIVALEQERQVRDVGLLDDLRATASRLDPDRGRAAIAAHLGRLDAAGELLEANVRPELVLDTLLLAWSGGPAASAGPGNRADQR